MTHGRYVRCLPGSRAVGLRWLVLLGLAGCFGPDEIQQPVPLYGDEPIEYPLSMWDQGLEGETILRVRVTDVGTVDSVEVSGSSGHAVLDSAAVAGVRIFDFSRGEGAGSAFGCGLHFRCSFRATSPLPVSADPVASHESGRQLGCNAACPPLSATC